MLTLDPAEHAYLAARKPLKTRHLIWVTAKNRVTGDSETLGLWTGDDHQDFVVEGETRAYYGAGNILALDEIPRVASLEVRLHQIRLSPLSPEIQLLIRGYDVRLAPIQIHRARFNAETDELLAAPRRILKGWVETIDIKTGDRAECIVKAASNARAGTRGLTLKKSDSSQRLRQLTGGRQDAFYQYTDVSGAVPVSWGEE